MTLIVAAEAIDMRFRRYGVVTDTGLFVDLRSALDAEKARPAPEPIGRVSTSVGDVFFTGPLPPVGTLLYAAPPALRELTPAEVKRITVEADKLFYASEKRDDEWCEYVIRAVLSAARKP